MFVSHHSKYHRPPFSAKRWLNLRMYHVWEMGKCQISVWIGINQNCWYLCSPNSSIITSQSWWSSTLFFKAKLTMTQRQLIKASTSSGYCRQIWRTTKGCIHSYRLTVFVVYLQQLGLSSPWNLFFTFPMMICGFCLLLCLFCVCVVFYHPIIFNV